VFTHTPLLLTFVDPVSHQTITIPIGEQAAITANAHTIRSDVLLRPNLLITSGEEHEIFAGDNIPIPVAHSGTGTPTGTTGSTVSQSTPSLVTRKDIQRQDVGTSLRLTPTVGEQGGVMLGLHVEVSSLSESAAGSVEEVGPTISQITVESMIRLRGGEVAVIASAARPQIEKTSVGVPWLKDVPILGWAFRFTSDQHRKRHLLIAARAQILRAQETRDLADRLARELGTPAPAAAAPP